MPSSTGLRYELKPLPSRWRGLCLVSGYGVLGVLLLLLAPPLLWFRGMLGVLVIALAGWHWRQPALPVGGLWFDEQGQLSWAVDGRGQLLPASLTTPWCCFLRVRLEGGRESWWAVYRDQLGDPDFRRLARTLHRVRRTGTQIPD